MSGSYEFYREQLNKQENWLVSERKTNTQLSYARLASFIGGWVLFYFLFAVSWPVALGVLGLCLVAFLFLVKRQLKCEKGIIMAERKVKLLQQELKCINFEFTDNASGNDFMPEQHDYAADLDVLGRHSLFQYVNRACTRFGQEKLASWLLSAAEPSAIQERQEVVEELREKYDFRTQLACELQDLENDLLVQLKTWSETEEEDTVPALFKYYWWTFVPLLWVAIAAAVFSDTAFSLLPYMFAVNILFHIRYTAVFAQHHSKTSRTSDLLTQLKAAVGVIENEEFKHQTAKDLQQELHDGVWFTEQLERLSSYVNKWDFRLNFVVYILVANLFVWDILWLLRVQSWKKKHKAIIGKAIDKLADFEAYSSLATLAFNHPDWCVPQLNEDKPMLFENLGHPLIAPKSRVPNDFIFRDSQELVFISGSNMSGKSTFIRSVGVNMVLAQAGAVVCASSFRFRPVRLFSIMRIHDSIEENTSTFYYEIKRIKQLLERVKGQPNVLYLLDELLRGTNSNDKQLGTKALMEWLMPRSGQGFIASHDLELANLENDHDLFSNYHFDVQIDNQKMDFDYKLQHGRCSVFNAKVLLREIGIELGDD